MTNNNYRQHKRMSATAFLNMPVRLKPVEPYFGEPLEGRLIDLSAGGLAILISQMIPQGTRLSLVIGFPDHSKLESTVIVKHASPRDRKFLHGFEFLSLPSYMSDKIENMSNDYIDCENRIDKKQSNICQTNCAFFNMCKKPQRIEPVVNIDLALELAFKSLEDTPLSSH